MGRWVGIRLKTAFITLLLLAVTTSAQSIPLLEVRDWNDRPLPCGTVFLYDAGGNVVDVIKVVNGRLERKPTAANVATVKIAWGWTDDSLRAVWIYDSSIPRDVAELGDAIYSRKVRTYVYPLSVAVTDAIGRPLGGYTVVVSGFHFYSASRTGAHGGAVVVDSICGGELSQVPPGAYSYYVYDLSGGLAASGRFDIQRGAIVPAEGFNIVVTVGEPRGGVGGVVVSGVRLADGSVRNLTIPIDVAEGRAVLLGELPPGGGQAAIYLKALPVGDAALPARGLVFNGSLDVVSKVFTEPVYVNVAVRAVGRGGGALRGAVIQVRYGDYLLANGTETVSLALPRSDLLEGLYTAVVVSSAVLPNGRLYVASREFVATPNVSVIDFVIPAVDTVVRAVDGFGRPRFEWPVEVVNVTSGRGEAAALLIEGERYVARASGLGFVNTTVFTPGGEVVVVIPTAIVEAHVIDGFGNVRSEWNVEIVGVASGRGKAGPVEVIAGVYTATAEAFGRRFTTTSTVERGQRASLIVQVPTTKLRVVVLEADGSPATRVGLHISGPVALQASQPTAEFELLAGSYAISAFADGRNATVEVVLEPGAAREVVLTLPPRQQLPPETTFIWQQTSPSGDSHGQQLPLETIALVAAAVAIGIFVAIRLRARK